MTKIQFEEMIEGLGFTAVGYSAFGSAGDFPFYSTFNFEGETSFTFCFLTAGDPAFAMQILKKKHIQYVKWQADGQKLWAYAQLPSDFYIRSTIHTILSSAKAAFAETGTQHPSLCPLCSNPGCDVFAFVQDSYQPAHKSCLDNRLQVDLEDKTLPALYKGNYLTGVLGALLGALIGILPLWNQALSKGRMTSLLYIVIPLFSALLYRLFRGKAKRNFALVSIFLSSVAAVFVLEQVWHWLSLEAAYGKSVAIGQSIRHFFQTVRFASLIKELWLSLLVMMVGMLLASRILERYIGSRSRRSQVIRGKKYSMQTVRPIHPAQQEDENAYSKENHPEG